MLGTQLVSMVLVTSLAALWHAMTGFGFALVAVPLLSVLIGPRSAVVTVVLISLMLYLGAWTRTSEHVDLVLVRRTVGYTLIGLPLGAVALVSLGERLLLVLVGTATAVLAGLLLLRRQRVANSPARHFVAACISSGALLSSTGMNGPPLVLSFQRLGLSPDSFRANLQASFALQQLFAIAVFAVSGQLTVEVAQLVLVGAPALALGWWVGNGVFKRMLAGQHAVLVFIALFGASATALVRAVTM